MLPSSPEQENSTNFQPKTQTSINRDYFNGIESNDLNVFDNSNKYNISHEANHERNHAKPTLLPGQTASSASKQPPKNNENNQKMFTGDNADVQMKQVGAGDTYENINESNIVVGDENDGQKTKPTNDNNVIIVPNELKIDPAWDQIIQKLW